MSAWSILIAVASLIVGWLMGEWYAGKVARRRHETKVVLQSDVDKASWKPHTYDTLSMDACVKLRGDNTVLLIYHKDDYGFRADLVETYELALRYLEESNDHGKTWHPCGQPVKPIQTKDL